VNLSNLVQESKLPSNVATCGCSSTEELRYILGLEVLSTVGEDEEDVFMDLITTDELHFKPV
jgi:hypothetical protein